MVKKDFIYCRCREKKKHISSVAEFILMLHFSLLEVYDDVVHLQYNYVYYRHNQRGSDLSVSGTELKRVKKKKAFLFPDRRLP